MAMTTLTLEQIEAIAEAVWPLADPEHWHQFDPISYPVHLKDLVIWIAKQLTGTNLTHEKYLLFSRRAWLAMRSSKIECLMKLANELLGEGNE